MGASRSRGEEEQGAGEILNESTLVDEYEQIKLRYCFQGVLDWMSALDRYGFSFPWLRGKINPRRTGIRLSGRATLIV